MASQCHGHQNTDTMAAPAPTRVQRGRNCVLRAPGPADAAHREQPRAPPAGGRFVDAAAARREQTNDVFLDNMRNYSRHRAERENPLPGPPAGVRSQLRTPPAHHARQHRDRATTGSTTAREGSRADHNPASRRQLPRLVAAPGCSSGHNCDDAACKRVRRTTPRVSEGTRGNARACERGTF